MANYDKEVRPSDTVSVTTTFHLLAINEVNTKDETFTTTGYFELEWEDSRLTWTIASYGAINELFFYETEIWRPAVVISNEVKTINVVNNEKVPMRVSNTGEVTWSPPLLIKTSCDMDITYYPFDRQTCSITMRSWAYHIDEISLEADVIDMAEFSENGEWLLENQVLDRTKDQNGGNSYSTLTFTFYLMRRPGHYVMNALVPTVMMSFLAPIVFILPAEAGEKVSYSITVFLAYAVLLTMITDTLPTSSKTTSGLSVYLTVITVMGALAVLITVKILEIYHRDEEKKIPALTRSLNIFLERISCQRRASSKSNTIAPADPEVGLPVKKPLPGGNDGDDNKEKITWKDVAVTWDIFLFRFTLILSIMMAITFLLFMMVPYYITDNSQRTTAFQ